MASSTLQLLLFTFILLLSSSYAQTSFRPHGIVLPTTKDASTLQYLTKINQRIPLVPVTLVVDLGGQILWVDCERNYVSSSYRPVWCRSAQCSLARANGCGDCFNGPRPGCNNNTCGVSPDNTVTRTSTGGELAEDFVSVSSTNGFNPGPAATVSRYLFSCAPTFLLQGLASGAMGMAGLGRTRVSFPSQFASAFSFHRKFAICLSSSTTAPGVVFFGDGPYNLLPNIDASQILTYTPLFINPVSTASSFTPGEPSTEYFIGVKAININSKPISINTSLLTIDSNGNGGTKISTVNPYTLLETSIYKAFTDTFIKEAELWNTTRVAAVAPFEACYDHFSSTRVGPAVPWIDLVLPNGKLWTITGSNSMVSVSDTVVCLGFLNGGENPRTSIVIGGYQLEDKLLQFDLASSRLGFSSTLFFSRTTCANFNFTSS